MSQTSTIEWTDSTWNPVRGCTKISPGCKNCYAERFAERFRGVPGHPFERGFDIRLVPEKLHEPEKWTIPKKIFVNSMSDLFHMRVPIGYIRQVCDVMLRANHHEYQVLTKRAEGAGDIAFVAQWAHDRNVPLMCDEWGVYRNFSMPENRERWLTAARTAFEKIRIGWTMWDYQGGFGVVYKDGNQVRDDDIALRALGLKK